MNRSSLFKLKSLALTLFVFLDITIPRLINSSEEKLHVNSFLGDRVNLESKWVGINRVSKSISILVLAGHADSQGVSGAGTSGEAVSVKGALPMNSLISDELFWNLLVRDAIVAIGKEKQLNIHSYDPKIRNIDDPNNPITNWSVGSKHVRKGGYAIEIHFDSYGEYGLGSGLIPPVSSQLNTLDESLAKEFGRYPILFRGGLGGPRRGIRILEIGKLEGSLEDGLRDPKTREIIIKKISNKVVEALIIGLSSNSESI